MRGGRLLGLGTALLLAGCTAPVVMESPGGQLVNCSAEAAARLPGPDPMVTHPNLPPPPGASLGDLAYDYVQQCVSTLKRDGWTCRSGCRAP